MTRSRSVADRARLRAAQLVRPGRLVGADRRRRQRRAPAARGRPRDPRHEQPGRMQQPRPPAPAAGRRDPRAGRAAVLRHQCLGRAAARGAGASGCWSGRVSRAAGCSSPWAAPTPTSTRSRSRARRRGQAARLLVTRDRSYHGATYLAMALSGDSRTQRQVDGAGARRAPRAAALCVSLPVRQRDDGTSAASARLRPWPSASIVTARTRSPP